MNDWSSMVLVPEVRRLGLSRVGCWDKLEMEFLPGLNVITEVGSACGKSTILRSILQTIRPTAGVNWPLTPSEGAAEGRIAVELMNIALRCRLVSPQDPPVRHSGAVSMGQHMLETLRSHLRVSQVGMCLLIDEDITSPLDTPRYREAVRLLNEAQCQVICVIGYHRFDQGGFPSARVFACTGGDKGKAEIMLLRAGEEI